MAEGWISLHRSIWDHWLWQEEIKYTKLQAWLDLLLLANHAHRKILIGNELTTIEVGQHLTSQQKLMKRWGWGNTKVRNFLKLLKEDGMIDYWGESYTIIKIINYEMYQKQTELNPAIPIDSPNGQIADKLPTNCEQTDNKSQTNCEQIQTVMINNDNNLNNDNKYMHDPTNEALELCKYYSSLKPGQSITQHLPTLKMWINDYGFNWTKEATEKCLKNKHKFIQPYIEALLKNWQKDGKGEQSGRFGSNNSENEGKYDFNRPYTGPSYEGEIDF